MILAHVDEYKAELEGATARAKELNVINLDEAIDIYLDHSLQGKTPQPRDDEWEVCVQLGQ